MHSFILSQNIEQLPQTEKWIRMCRQR